MLIINITIFAVILCCVVVSANPYSSEHAERQQIVAEIKEYFDKKILVLEETHKFELIKLQEYYKSEITKNEENHKAEIKALEAKLLYEIDSLKKDMMKEKIKSVEEIDTVNLKLETEEEVIAKAVADLKSDTGKSRRELQPNTDQRVREADKFNTVRAIDSKVIEDTEERTQSRKRQLGTATRVAFFASVTNDTHILGTHQDIKFDNAVTNVGQAYNPHHGTFIAPVAGVYLFTVTLSHPYGAANGHIMKNGQILAKLSFVYYDGQSSQTVIVELEKGDDIYVENDKTDGRGIMGDRHSTFAGFLIYEHSSATAMPLVVGKL